MYMSRVELSARPQSAQSVGKTRLRASRRHSGGSGHGDSSDAGGGSNSGNSSSKVNSNSSSNNNSNSNNSNKVNHSTPHAQSQPTLPRSVASRSLRPTSPIVEEPSQALLPRLTTADGTSSSSHNSSNNYNNSNNNNNLTAPALTGSARKRHSWGVHPHSQASKKWAPSQDERRNSRVRSPASTGTLSANSTFNLATSLPNSLPNSLSNPASGPHPHPFSNPGSGLHPNQFSNTGSGLHPNHPNQFSNSGSGLGTTNGSSTANFNGATGSGAWPASTQATSSGTTHPLGGPPDQLHDTISAATRHLVEELRRPANAAAVVGPAKSAHQRTWPRIRPPALFEIVLEKCSNAVSNGLGATGGGGGGSPLGSVSTSAAGSSLTPKARTPKGFDNQHGSSLFHSSADVFKSGGASEGAPAPLPGTPADHYPTQTHPQAQPQLSQHHQQQQQSQQHQHSHSQQQHQHSHSQQHQHSQQQQHQQHRRPHSVRSKLFFDPPGGFLSDSDGEGGRSHTVSSCTTVASSSIWHLGPGASQPTPPPRRTTPPPKPPNQQFPCQAKAALHKCRGEYVLVLERHGPQTEGKQPPSQPSRLAPGTFPSSAAAEQTTTTDSTACSAEGATSATTTTTSTTTTTNTAKATAPASEPLAAHTPELEATDFSPREPEENDPRTVLPSQDETHPEEGALPHEGKPSLPLPTGSSPWAQVQQRWHEHRRWAAEAWREMQSLQSEGRDTGGVSTGLPPPSFETSLCSQKLLECLADADAQLEADETKEARRSGVAEVQSLTKFLARKAALEADQLLPFSEFETFTWKLRQMEQPVEALSKPDFAFKMFGANKIGKLTRMEFIKLFAPNPDDDGEDHKRQDAAGNSVMEMTFSSTTFDRSLDLGPTSAVAKDGAEDDDAPAWGAWAAPSESSSSSSSRASSKEPRSRASSPNRRGRDSLGSPNGKLSQGLLEAHATLELGQEELESLLSAPAAWRELVRKKGLMHRDWSASRFTSLDRDGDGALTRADLSGASFARVLLECLGDRLPESEDVETLVDAAMRGADVEGSGCLAAEDFEAFTWRLKRMVADTDFEVVQALGVEQGATWKRVLHVARALHTTWASTAFAALDLNSRGQLTRSDLKKPGFEYLLRQCPGGRLADIATVRPCVGLAFRRADTKGSGKLSQKAFEDFSWQLARMGADAEAEGRRFAELAKGRNSADAPLDATS